MFKKFILLMLLTCSAYGVEFGVSGGSSSSGTQADSAQVETNVLDIADLKYAVTNKADITNVVPLSVDGAAEIPYLSTHPSTRTSGDLWSTSAGLYFYLNSVRSVLYSGSQLDSFLYGDLRMPEHVLDASGESVLTEELADGLYLNLTNVVTDLTDSGVINTTNRTATLTYDFTNGWWITTETDD